MTLNDPEWPFTLNSVFVKFDFKICLFPYTDSAVISMEYGYIYVCRKFVSYFIYILYGLYC